MIVILSIALFLLIILAIVIFIMQKKGEENKPEVWKPNGYILGKDKKQIKAKILDSHDDAIKVQYFSGYFWNTTWIKKSEFFKNRTLDELNDVVYKLEEKLDGFNYVLHKLEEK